MSEPSNRQSSMTRDEITATEQRAPGTDEAAGRIQRFEFRDFAVQADRSAPPKGLSEDQQLNLRIELGRAQMCRDDVQELRRGSVVSLDKLSHEPADVLVDGELLARGEVVVLEGMFCLRVTELVDGSKSP